MVLFTQSIGFTAINQKRTTLFDYRFWQSPDHTRIVIDTQKDIKYKVQKQNGRVMLFVQNAKLLTKTYKNLFYQDKRIKKTTILRKNQDVKIYFWTNKNYKITSFFLKPNIKYPYYRLVIDITGEIKNVVKKINKPTKHKTIILLDPGHGGEDSGAVGKKSYEKNIVLKISKRLQKLLNQNPNFQAILTRKSDYFINLSKRPKLAQNQKAQAFISIHADSALREGANGSSIYVLSRRGGITKLAKKLEKSENANDIFNNQGIKQDWVVKTIMRDLARDNKKTESLKLASSILNKMRKIRKLHKKTPQQANFVVLKTPAIPSVLIEVGFISNRDEEQKLNNSYEQSKIARAIYAGVLEYFKK